MKNIKHYLYESVEDGKNGHWEEYSDEMTGELVNLWVPDPTPEEIAKREQSRQQEEESYWDKREKEEKLYKELNIDKLEDDVWALKSELKDLHKEYRQLEIDQEEEVGSLYVQGKEAEAEELAQEYGDKFNQISDKQVAIERKLIAAQNKLSQAEDKIIDLRAKLWG